MMPKMANCFLELSCAVRRLTVGEAFGPGTGHHSKKAYANRDRFITWVGYEPLLRPDDGKSPGLFPARRLP